MRLAHCQNSLRDSKIGIKSKLPSQRVTLEDPAPKGHPQILILFFIKKDRDLFRVRSGVGFVRAF